MPEKETFLPPRLRILRFPPVLLRNAMRPVSVILLHISFNSSSWEKLAVRESMSEKETLVPWRSMILRFPPVLLRKVIRPVSVILLQYDRFNFSSRGRLKVWELMPEKETLVPWRSRILRFPLVLLRNVIRPMSVIYQQYARFNSSTAKEERSCMSPVTLLLGSLTIFILGCCSNNCRDLSEHSDLRIPTDSSSVRSPTRASRTPSASLGFPWRRSIVMPSK